MVSRIKQDSHLIGPEGGVLSSTLVPQVQAVFPEGALTKKIRVGLQVRTPSQMFRVVATDEVVLTVVARCPRLSPLRSRW